MAWFLALAEERRTFSEENYRLYFNGKAKQASIFSIPSGTMGTMSSEISMRFGLRGMSHVITTGCTSSTDAFGYALRQIQFGFIPVLLVGGVDAPIAPGIMKGFALMRIMTSSWNHAPERASRPFSADRDGFVLAEGAWMFVLEEYEHASRPWREIYRPKSRAMARRARLSIACGWQECGEEPARAIQMAMEDAGIAASDVNYVNLHGTSTQLNDRIETRALKLALGTKACRHTDVESEVADWTSSGSLGRSGHRRNPGGHDSSANSADDQPGEARSGMRPRLCS